MIGLLVALVFRPGAAVNADPSNSTPPRWHLYVTTAAKQTTVEFLLNIIPLTLVGAFSEGQHPAGHVRCDPDRPGVVEGRRTRRSADEADRSGVGRSVRRAWLHHDVCRRRTFGAMAFTVGAYGVRARCRWRRSSRPSTSPARCSSWLSSVQSRGSVDSASCDSSHTSKTNCWCWRRRPQQVALPRLMSKLEQLGCRQRRRPRRPDRYSCTRRSGDLSGHGRAVH